MRRIDKSLIAFASATTAILMVCSCGSTSNDHPGSAGLRGSGGATGGAGGSVAEAGTGGGAETDAGLDASVDATDDGDASWCVPIDTDAGLEAPVDAEEPDADAGGYSGVYAPDSSPVGKTYAEWLGAFWQWLLQIPASTSPIFGGDCTQGQSGDVWYLTPGPNMKPQERACTIPSGKSVYVPVVSNFCQWTPETGCPDPPDPDLSYCAAKMLQQPILIAVEVDGVPITGLQAYRVTTDTWYIINPPVDDPLFDLIGPVGPNNCGVAEGDRLARAVGFAVMLVPLSVGTHTVHIARQDFDCAKKTDVVYTLTIQ